MADGVTFQTSTLATPPSGTEVATDDAGADGHVQIVKLARSADGSAVPITADADGILVNLGANNDVTVTGTVTANIAAGTNNIGDVDVLSVPAPLSTTGAGTEAAALRVTVATDSTGVLSVDDNGGSLTVDGTVAVSGTVAVTQSGTWDEVGINDSGNSITVDDGGSSLTVDGSVSVSGAVDTELTTADLDTGAGTDTRAVVGIVGAASGGAALIPGSATAGLKVDLGTDNDVTVTGSVTANAGTNLNTSALALETGGNLAGAATSLAIIDDWDESDRAKVNLIVGQAGVAAGAGVVSATTQRVTVATDDVVSVDDNGGSLTVDGTVGVSGTVAVDQTDTAAIDYDTGAGTVNQAVMGLALPGTGGPVAGGTSTNPVRTDPTGSTTQPISGTVTASNTTGNVAHDAVDSGNPVKIGGKASNTTPTVVAAGDRVDSWYNLRGAQGAFLTDPSTGDAAPVSAATGLFVSVENTPIVENAYNGNSDAAVTNTVAQVGARASTAIPTAMSADGDAVHLWANRNGAQVQTQAPHVGLNSDPWNLVHEAAQYTTTQTSTILVDAAAGEKIVVTKVQIQAGGTTAGAMQLYFGTGAYSRGTNRAIFDGEFAPSATLKPGVVMDGPFIAGANGDDLRVTTSAAINPLTVSVWYYVVT